MAKIGQAFVNHLFMFTKNIFNGKFPYLCNEYTDFICALIGLHCPCTKHEVFH